MARPRTAARTTKQKCASSEPESLEGTVREARRREAVTLAAGAASSGKRIVDLEGVTLARAATASLVKDLDLVLGPGGSASA
ncbi:MAG: hypothetical protein U0325_20030 [Polyangiales bacterium]